MNDNIDNKYTYNNILQIDSYTEGVSLAYTSLVDKLSNKTTRMKSYKAIKKAKSKRRMVKQSRKHNR